MNISVIICTYNRCESLKLTLDSLLLQGNLDNFSYEIIVVDNNSNDNTKTAVKSYLSKFNCNFQYIFEPLQGLSIARNRGLKESKNQIVAFADDDVIVDNGWLYNINRTFIKYNADAVFGRVNPSWEVENIPTWIKQDKRLWGMLACLDYGDEKKVIVCPNEPFHGANFAIRREVLVKFGGFKDYLGVKGEKHFLGEETEIFRLILKSGLKIVYDPNILVKHRITENRTTKEYFYNYNYYGGYSFAAMLPPAKRTVFNVPLWFAKEFLQMQLRFIYYFLTGNKKDGFWFRLKSIYYFGALLAFIKRNKVIGVFFNTVNTK